MLSALDKLEITHGLTNRAVSYADWASFYLRIEKDADAAVNSLTTVFKLLVKIRTGLSP